MAGRIPQQFIDDLLTRVDIVEVIDARVPLKKQGREYAACCPFHGEKTASFTVSPTKQFYHCFGCGAHGTAITFLMEYDNLDFVEAVEQLAESLGLEVPREGGRIARGPTQQAGTQTDLYAVMAAAADYYRRQLGRSQAAIDYLKGRGLTGATARDYGLGYAPDGWDNLLTELRPRFGVEALEQAGLITPREHGGYYDRFRRRIMFPIRDRRGRVIAFGARVIDDGEPKYLNSPETAIFHKGRELYGLYEARRADSRLERVWVVEGYVDVLALAQAGLPNTVATLGTATTRDHLERLFRVVPEVVFCFDGDRAGRQAAWRALESALPAMRDGRAAWFLFLPQGEDPDSLVRAGGGARWQALYEEAVSLSDFLIRGLREAHNTATREGRARLVETARPLLQALTPGALRDQILESVAHLGDLSRDRLEQRLRGPQTKGEPAQPRGGPGDPLQVQVTPVRLALALLLQFPVLAQDVDAAWLSDADQPGVDLLADVVETARRYPNLHSAALIEHWRDSEQGRHLLKLLEWDLGGVDEAVARRMFRDALQRLWSRHQEKRTEWLLEAAQRRTLNEQEKAELQALLQRPS